MRRWSSAGRETDLCTKHWQAGSQPCGGAVASSYGRYVSRENPAPEDFATSPRSAALTEVDAYGVPLYAFGKSVPPQFFEVIGRLLAVNGKIEYLQERLNHLPSVETEALIKVEKFLKRYRSGRLERNAIVHSYWVFGAVAEDAKVIVGIRYKTSRSASGEIATVSLRDIAGSEKDQVVTQYSLAELRTLLKRDIATMSIGMQAHSEVALNWAVRQVAREQN